MTTGKPAWWGEFDGQHIVSLFDPPHNVAPSTAFQTGDIVSVGVEQTLIASAGSAMRQVVKILAQHQLNPVHPVAVQSEAERYLASDFGSDSSLENLSSLPFVTIDNEDSRDLDQALYLEAQEDGFTIYYALADAAWFIRTPSALFDEALRRAVTYYVPGMSVRMLPAVLSEDLISLNPDELRRALVFRIVLDGSGQISNTTITRALIRSHAKLSYPQVQRFYDYRDGLNSNPADSFDDKPWKNSLIALEQVGKLRLDDARQRDVVNFNRREAQVNAMEDSFTITVRERNNAEKYNEQISLLCNIEGARLLQENDRPNTDLQAIYRVHQPPLRQRINDFRKTLDELIAVHDLPADWHWQHGEALADFLLRISTQATATQRGLLHTIERMAMLTNRASEFESEADQHHALGVDAYARFSSPMREVVGIFTHKELLEAFALEPPLNRIEDEQIRQQVIERANEGKKLQRKLEKTFRLLALNDFLSSDLELPARDRPWRTATLVGIRKKRLYLHLDGLAMEVKIYLDDLAAERASHFQLDDVRAVNRENPDERFLLGEHVLVQTRQWVVERQRFLFSLRKPDD